ncbi:MAG: hypothetical protein ACLUOI_04060 [Eisenbergiella sp.]
MQKETESENDEQHPAFCRRYDHAVFGKGQLGYPAGLPAAAANAGKKGIVPTAV